MSDPYGTMTDIRDQWIVAEAGRGVPFQLSIKLDKITAPVAEIRQKPAIYRWSFLKKRLPIKAYIGETEDLRKRVRGYLNPGPSQETNKRIKAEFKGALQSGLTVQLEILYIEPIRINRVRVSTEHLFDPFLRRMLENFVLADFDVVNCELLNLALNPLERRKRKAMKDNPLEALFHQHGMTD